MKLLIFLGLFGAALAGPTGSKRLSFGPIHSNRLLSVLIISDKITGGSNATAGEIPWQVSMQIKPAFGDKYHTCGGTILNENHIVTAAHCVEGQRLSEVTIVAGAHNIKEEETTQQVRTVKRLIWNPKFDSDLLTHDSAVITLTSPLVFNDRVQPLKLADEGFQPSGECLNSGWGNANPTGGTPATVPDQLQKITLKIVERPECTEMYSFINNVDETMVCAGGLTSSPQGSCNGDSGGPLVCKDANGGNVLQGIVSWGMNPCGQAEYPTVFGNVAAKEMRDFLVTEGERP